MKLGREQQDPLFACGPSAWTPSRLFACDYGYSAGRRMKSEDVLLPSSIRPWILNRAAALGPADVSAPLLRHAPAPRG